jgi:hypothetical protein
MAPRSLATGRPRRPDRCANPRTASMSAARPTRKTLQRCLVFFVALFVCFVLGELAYRGVRLLQGRPYDSAAVGRTLAALSGKRSTERDDTERAIVKAAQLVDAEGKRMVLHPYFGFDVAGDTRLLEVIQKCPTTVPPGERFDVLVLGGSVAGILAEASCRAFSIALQSDPRLGGAPVEIHSYARGGFKEPQHALALTYLFAQGFDCDLVILIDGFNEVALGNANARHNASPLFPSLSHWAYLSKTGLTERHALDLLVDLRASQKWMERVARGADVLGFEHSAILGELALAVVGRFRNKSVELQQRFALTAKTESTTSPTLHGPDYPADTTARFEMIVRSWSECSRSIDAMCRARGIPFLHVLQPTLYDEGSKPISEEERRTGRASVEWVEGVHEGYPVLRAQGEKLRALGIDFVDLSMVFRDVKESLYFDACHFNGKGNIIFARAIADAVRRDIDLPQPALGR